MSELAARFNKYKCDKSDKHQYETVYEPHFEPRRNDDINILEIGTYKGASTRALHDYFPKANIYTIDFFQRTNPEDLDILNEERVHWIKSDSTVVGLPLLIKEQWGDVKFDFVIDDGGHWPMANLLTFKNIYPRLVEGGTYFIEDVWPLELMTFGELQHPWILRDKERYNMLDNNNFLAEINKHTVVRHDNRKKTRCADSYIIAVSD
jgi:predicted O-methyltransferase YrrM